MNTARPETTRPPCPADGSGAVADALGAGRSRCINPRSTEVDHYMLCVFKHHGTSDDAARYSLQPLFHGSFQSRDRGWVTRRAIPHQSRPRKRVD